MKLSTRSRYGARAMVEIALAYPDGTVSVKRVSERQNISHKYLERIMRELKNSGFLKAVRGMHGGYALARSPESITLKDIIEALDGSLAPVQCVDHPESCSVENVCPTRDTWAEMKTAMETVLENTTLQDLVDRKKRKEAVPGEMYAI